ncbi:hypothetical protein N7462_000002 [Penicillium macrosclerotiorum]|uniref:uncharacterized protein n=1 Tax=Penicillium macrosclerotiorum TaxID=303699 RepID=UPI00254831C7|nr:uncharacterized protein N7462_000002 [Penicillium macrosclerotiorum]KAJ5697997.1 hypothetical protein N7462_000002 [Penicillium macrosclerotiorum]
MSEMPKRSPGHLPSSHSAPLFQILSHILASDLGIVTFAQIADGCPIRGVYKDYYVSVRQVFEDRLEPSEDAIALAKDLRDHLSMDDIMIDSDALQAYQNSPIGSERFILRFIEVVAIAIHHLATALSQKVDGGLNQPNPIEANRPPDVIFEDGSRMELKIKAHKTALFHPAYEFWEQYPDGIADIIGYWAEYRIFGGVVLFDRGQSELEAQKSQFARFALAALDSHSRASEWMRLEDERCTRQIEPSHAMSLHIYRNKYERNSPPGRPHPYSLVAHSLGPLHQPDNLARLDEASSLSDAMEESSDDTDGDLISDQID